MSEQTKTAQGGGGGHRRRRDGRGADRRRAARAGLDRPVTLSAPSPTSRTTGRRCPRRYCSARPRARAFDVDFDALGIELRLGRRRHRAAPGRAPAGHRGRARPVRRPGHRHRRRAGHPARQRGRPRRPSAAHPGRRRSGCARCSREQHDVVVVGAGWIGAEFATAAREAGCAVTVVEAADRPLAGRPARRGRRPDGRAGTRRAAPSCSPARGWPASSRAGCCSRDGTPAAGRRGRRRHRRPARDRLAGRAPASSSARTARSPPTSGCAPRCPTCTRSATAPPSRPPATATRLLVHHWDNALQGPRTVAAQSRRRGRRRRQVYDPVPYFWSEQFGRFVQYAGHHAAADDAGLARRPGRRRLVGVLAAGRRAGRPAGRRPSPRPGPGPQADRARRPAGPDAGRGPVGTAEVGRSVPLGPPVGAGPADAVPAARTAAPGYRLSVRDGTLVL